MGVAVGTGDGVAVGARVGVGAGVDVGARVGAGSGVDVGGAVAVGIGVGVIVAVGSAVAVGARVGVGIAVAVFAAAAAVEVNRTIALATSVFCAGRGVRVAGTGVNVEGRFVAVETGCAIRAGCGVLFTDRRKLTTTMSPTIAPSIRHGIRRLWRGGTLVRRGGVGIEDAAAWRSAPHSWQKREPAAKVAPHCGQKRIDPWPDLPTVNSRRKTSTEAV